MFEFTIAVIGGILCGLLIVAVLEAWYGYVDGRRTGGYPVFARPRKYIKIKSWAYNHGLRQSRNKIAKGGYK